MYRVQAFILRLFSKRSSRTQDRTKLKGHVWRRALFHFFLCFIVGFLVGLTPSFSMNLSKDLMSEQVHLPNIDGVGTVPLNDVAPGKNVTESNGVPDINNSVTLKPDVNDPRPVMETSNGTIRRTLLPGSEMGFNKFLIIVTATYSHPFLAYYLNRLAYTLKLVPPPLLWIVVEMTSQSAETAEILRRTGVMYRHLVCTKNITEIKDQKVHQRNVALLHIETHRLDGIIHFADDSNVYSNELFEQMRQIRRFGTWTIAKLIQSKNQVMLEGPICNETQVIGWHTNDAMRWYRRFHADISGFAFNSTVLWDQKRWHRPTPEPIRQSDAVKEGFHVSTLIEQIVEDETEMEGLPQDCSKVFVWRHYIKSYYSYPSEWSMKNNLDSIVPVTSKF